MAGEGVSSDVEVTVSSGGRSVTMTGKQFSKATRGRSMKKNQDSHVERTKGTETLKHVLSEAEIKKVGEEMAQAVIARDNAQESLEAIRAQYKSEISRAESTIALCARKLNNGWEMRPTEIETTRDYAAGYIRVVRQDTFETVRERAMTEEEKQTEMKLA